MPAGPLEEAMARKKTTGAELAERLDALPYAALRLADARQRVRLP
jgi:hypothetical protein